MLINAIQIFTFIIFTASVFKNGTIVRCQEHIKKNILNHLTENGATKEDKANIMGLLFGDEGVTSSETRVEFFDRMLKVPHDPFTPQYYQKVRSNLWKFVVHPRIETPYLPLNWKNNGCESLNHMVMINHPMTVSKYWRIS